MLKTHDDFHSLPLYLILSSLASCFFLLPIHPCLLVPQGLCTAAPSAWNILHALSTANFYLCLCVNANIIFSGKSFLASPKRSNFPMISFHNPMHALHRGTNSNRQLHVPSLEQWLPLPLTEFVRDRNHI